MSHGYNLRSSASAKGCQGQFPQSTEETDKATGTTTRYQENGGPLAPKFQEEIQAARQCEETRRAAEATRIGRKHIVRGYEEELWALRARIVALHQECDDRVKRTKRKWERKWAIECGEVAIVVEEGGQEGSDWNRNRDLEDVAVVEDGEMAIDDKNYAPANTSSLITNNDDDQHRRQWRSAPCRGQGHHQSPQAQTQAHPQPLRRQSAQLMAVP